VWTRKWTRTARQRLWQGRWDALYSLGIGELETKSSVTNKEVVEARRTSRRKAVCKAQNYNALGKPNFIILQYDYFICASTLFDASMLRDVASLMHFGTRVYWISWMLPSNCLPNLDDAARVQVLGLPVSNICVYMCARVMRAESLDDFFLFSLTGNRLLYDGYFLRIELTEPSHNRHCGSWPWGEINCVVQIPHNDREKLQNSTRVRIGPLQRRPAKSKTDSIQNRSGKLTVLWFLCSPLFLFNSRSSQRYPAIFLIGTVETTLFGAFERIFYRLLRITECN